MKNLTHKQLSQALTEWVQDYEANPDEFEEEYGDASSYGDVAATYLMDLLRQHKGKE